MKNNIKGLILAAGRGSRLGAMTEAQPKGMVQLGGHSLIKWQLSALRASGVNDISIITGYKSEVFNIWNLPTFHNENWANTNMVLSLTSASEWLMDSTCLVSYADIFFSPADVCRLINKECDIGVAYDPNWFALWEKRFENPYEDAESFSLQGDRIIDIGRPVSEGDNIEGQYLGLLKITPVGWGQIELFVSSLEDAVSNKIDMTTLLRHLINRGVEIKGSKVEDDWGEVDHPSDLEFYQKQLQASGYSWAKDIGLIENI